MSRQKADPKLVLLASVRRERVLTTSEAAKLLRCSWNTAEKHLLELALEGKLIRLKKEGVNLWLGK